MLQGTYRELLEKISKLTNLSIEELERRVDAKCSRLSGLISKQGAAQIVASELGVKFEGQRVKVSDLLPGMRKTTVIGKIIQIFPVREFIKKDMKSKVLNIVVADENSNVRVVFWDVNHIKFFEDGLFKTGDVVELQNISVRGTESKEVHLSSYSKIQLSTEKIENVDISMNRNQSIAHKEIKDLQQNERVKVRATVVQIFEPRFFDTCPECNKKLFFENGLYHCEEHGNVMPNHKALTSIIIDDGVETTRAILFDSILIKFLDLAKDNFIAKLKDITFFIEKKKEILGKEFFFYGVVKKNALFNNLEINISDMEEINPDVLIAELSKDIKIEEI